MSFYPCRGGGGSTKPYLLAENVSGDGGTIKYNISSLVENYQSLTKDNILVVPKKINILFFGGGNENRWYGAEANISISYTPSTGIILVSGKAKADNGNNGAYLTGVDIWIIPT